QHAAYIAKRPGGAGAVREVCDLIIRAKGTLGAALNGYIK
ncbi:phenylphosphate carboxylase subunit delta, partial [Neisseria gonorrhoeae]